MILHHDVGIMMTRTQISMQRETLRRARIRAGEEGISFAEYVRRLVVRDLGESSPGGDVSALFGLFDSGGSNVGRNKDHMIGQAIEVLNRK